MIPADWLDWRPSPSMVTAALLVAVIGSLAISTCHYNAKVETHERIAAEAKGKADSAVEQAKASDARAAAAEASLSESASEVERLRREVAARKQALPHAHTAVPTLPDPLPLPPSTPASVADLVASQDALIQAQAQRITLLEGQTATLASARNQWREAWTQERVRSQALEVALQAQKSASKSQKWAWAGGGLLLGLGLGGLK